MFLLYFQHSNKWDSGLVQLLPKIYWPNTIPAHAAFLWTISSWLVSRFKDLQLLSELEIVKWEGRQQWPMKTLLESPLVPITDSPLLFVKIFPGWKNVTSLAMVPHWSKIICHLFKKKKRFWCIYIQFSSIYCITTNTYVTYCWSTLKKYVYEDLWHYIDYERNLGQGYNFENNEIEKIAGNQWCTRLVFLVYILKINSCFEHKWAMNCCKPWKFGHLATAIVTGRLRVLDHIMKVV